MSGILKGVGKVFKKVVKVVKKVAPYVLAAAAIYFTAGAALGVAGTAGGWSAAVSNFVTSTIGATGTLGNVLTGAITSAGYGSLIGGATAAVTGGDISKGLLSGAAAGAVTGGVAGGFGIGVPEAGAAANAGETAAASGITSAPLAPPGLDSAAVASGASEGLWAPAANAASGAVGAGSAAGAGTAAGGSFLDRALSTLGSEKVVGEAVGGLGKGLLAYAGSDAEADALDKRTALERQQHADRQGSYNAAGPGLLTSRGNQRVGANPAYQSPADRFAAPAYANQLFRFDPATGRLVPVTA